jgi:D-alanyl-D-alanine carboxypeptidase
VHGYQGGTDVTSRYEQFTPELGGAAGAMVATLGDLVQLARALGTGELLTPAMQRQRVTFPAGAVGSFAPLPGNGVPAVLPGSYGLGIGMLGHNGGTNGYQADMFYLPARNATVVLLLNGTPATSGGSLGDAAAVSLAEISLFSS